MTNLEAVMRLYKIKETVENQKMNKETLINLTNELNDIKGLLEDSGFAFDKVISLINDVGLKIEKAI